MDKYNTLLGKVLNLIHRNPVGYAITIRQTTYYSCAESEVDPRWHQHEDCHKRQWAKDGVIKFTCKYLWYSVLYGYWDNPYEVEARDAESLPPAV